jgi:ketosteroid isomerase-like protein
MRPTKEVVMFGRSKSSRQIAERFIAEGIAKADMAVFDALVADDIIVETGLSPQGPIKGRDAYKAVFAGFADSWPVTDFKVHQIDEAGDTIVIEFTATCIFRKDYYGVKATHQITPLREIHRLEVNGGKIVRNTVGAINFPFEYIMYPALKDAVIGNLQIAS